MSRKTLSIAEYVNILDRNARRALKARAKSKWDAVEEAEQNIQDALDELVGDSTPLRLNQVMSDFFGRYADKQLAETPARAGGLTEGDLACDLIVELLQGVTEVHVDTEGRNHQLFAVSLLVPSTERDWANANPLDQVQALESLFKRNGLIHPAASVQWLPRWVPFSSLLTISEWSVARLNMLLARANPADAATVASLFDEPVKEAQQLGNGAERLMETRVLVGTATMEGAEPLFPLGATMVDAMHAAMDDDEAQAASDATQEVLQSMNAGLAAILGVSEAQLATEVQGWWEDVGAVHRLMRSVHASQQLRALLQKKALLPAEVLASTRLNAHSDEPIGMGVPLFEKNGLAYLGELLVTALPHESPDMCAEEAYAFLHSIGVTMVDAALLPDGVAEEAPSAASTQAGRAASHRVLH